MRIEQTIYVERESQRKIVLGKAGPGDQGDRGRARADIASAIEQPVHLFLHVKVREGWSDDPERYREIGLEFPARKTATGIFRKSGTGFSVENVIIIDDTEPRIVSIKARNAKLPPMEWIDDGTVLGVKRHGETSVILELMTHAARPASRPGPRRCRLAAARRAAAGQCASRDLAGEARRTSGQLRRRGTRTCAAAVISARRMRFTA